MVCWLGAVKHHQFWSVYCYSLTKSKHPDIRLKTWLLSHTFGWYTKNVFGIVLKSFGKLMLPDFHLRQQHCASEFNQMKLHAISQFVLYYVCSNLSLLISPLRCCWEKWIILMKESVQTILRCKHFYFTRIVPPFCLTCNMTKVPHSESVVPSNVSTCDGLLARLQPNGLLSILVWDWSVPLCAHGRGNLLFQLRNAISM